MSGMESLRDVTLRPWPSPEQSGLSQQDLYVQIEQLTTERGHLRDITEASLLEDIRAGKDRPDGAVQRAQQAEDENLAASKQATRETIFNAQREMYGHLEYDCTQILTCAFLSRLIAFRWAKFAATNALDLISLVLSQDPNKRALTSFSHTFREQGLEQGIPLGSFGIVKESHEHYVPKPEEAERLEDLAAKQVLVAKGSRMEALDYAVEAILKAAKRLEKEVRRETKHWQEIVSVSNNGWPIQRLRQNARHVPFGVRYGFPEGLSGFEFVYAAHELIR